MIHWNPNAGLSMAADLYAEIQNLLKDRQQEQAKTADDRPMYLWQRKAGRRVIDRDAIETKPATTVTQSATRNDGLTAEPEPTLTPEEDKQLTEALWGPAQDRIETPDDELRFDNGNHIARDGHYIHPDSAEGKTIQNILDRQARDRAENAAQTALFNRVTQAENAHEAIAILQQAGKLPDDILVAEQSDYDARALMEEHAGEMFVGPMSREAMLAEIFALENTKPAFRTRQEQSRLDELRAKVAAI